MKSLKINYFRGDTMNDKKIYDLKLIKSKLNAAMVLIEEIQNLSEEFPELETSHLLGALEDLENQYYEVQDLED